MYRLFARYYLGASPARFERDLVRKDAVLLLRDGAGALCGFSTVAVFTMLHEGETIKIVFSGDTIVERAPWGSPVFAFSWLRYVGKIAARDPAVPLYWLLIVKGHRTYRYLPTFGLQFVPDWRGPGDAALGALKDVIAERQFGAAYNRAAGIVRFAQPESRLAPQWAGVTPREARRADVRFFLERNPGYARGDELVCLCALQTDNMRPLTRRLFLQGAAP